jgi:Replication-relaxation
MGMTRGNKGMRIQPRDHLILLAIWQLTIANREQVKIACQFGSTTRVNTRLLALVRVGLLRRFFRGSGAGAQAVYALSQRGADLVGVPLRGPRRRQNEVLVADFFVEHQLAINNLYCALRFRAIPLRGVEFRRWLSFHESLSPSLRLIPDGYVEFDTPSGTLAAFLEVDLGTEALSVWREKVRQYLELALSGDFAKKFGASRFRVLVVASSPRRLRSIRATVAAITPKIFWFATLDDAQQSFFAPVWLRPTEETQQPFIQEQP